MLYFTLPMDKRKSVALGQQLAAQKSARRIELGRPKPSPTQAPSGSIAAAHAAREAAAKHPAAQSPTGGPANGFTFGPANRFADGHTGAYTNQAMNGFSNGHLAAALPVMKHEEA